MKKIKALKSRKGREEAGQFLVEGEKFVHEIPEDWDIDFYVMAERYAKTHDLSVYKRRAACEIMRDSLFDALADTVTPQGVMAVCRQKKYAVSDMIKPDSFLLLGENLSDPGNIGALIRTAAAAGADGMILTAGSGDIYNPKVLRSAAGAVFRLPIVTDAELLPTTEILKKSGVALYAAHLKGEILPYALDLCAGFCFMIGNEAHGLSEKAAVSADRMVRLPMPGGTESLNASVAGSILMYEAVRQRFAL